MTDDFALVDNNESGTAKRKRGQSRTPSPSLACTTPKKMRSDSKTDSSLLQGQGATPESKRAVPAATLGGDVDLDTSGTKFPGNVDKEEELVSEASKDPTSGKFDFPSTWNDQNPQTWAQNISSTLYAIRMELKEIRNEIKALHQRPDMNLSKPTIVPDELSHNRTSRNLNHDYFYQPMEIEQPVPQVDSLSSGARNHETKAKSERNFLPPHAEYLDDCFTNRIGLDPQTRTNVNITSFDNVLVAKGYTRIVPTWQGYFVELEKEDIIFGSLSPNKHPAWEKKAG